MGDIPKFRFKNDAYMKRRGAPVMLIVRCAECNAYVMSYQKDGPGPLLRCYLDRIHHPENLEKRQYEVFHKKTDLKLACPVCHVVIGSSFIYEKEDRPAYHLRPGLFVSNKIY
jgi:hypothetical protein